MAAPCTSSDVKAMDILCGRTKFCTDHVGSIAYKAILETRLARYMNKNTESCDKTSMTIELVETIAAVGGRFLREKKTGSGVWEILCKTAAREKIRDGLRDAVKVARKNKGGADTEPYLTKMGLSLEVTEETSFAELVSRISEDPVMKQFLFESKVRQGATERKQKRIESHNASRKLSVQQATSCASAAKSNVKYTHMFAQQCSSSGDIGNFVPIMPAAQFVQAQLPSPQQALLPPLPDVPTLRSYMKLNYGHIFEKEKSARSIPQVCCPVPSFLFPDYRNISMVSRSMINDDPWGEGDFEKEADPHGGDFLLKALQQADKLADFTSNSQEAADDKANILNAINEDVRSDGDDLLEAFDRVDELFEAVNLPVTQEAGLDNNENADTSNGNTQNPTDEDDLPEALERADDYFEAATDLLPGDHEAVSDSMGNAVTSNGKVYKPSSVAYKRKFTKTAWSTWRTIKRQRRMHQEEPPL